MELNDLDSGKRKLIVAGEAVTVNATDNVEITLRRVLTEKGIDSFTIVIDGKELFDTDDRPETFGDHDVEVKRYVKAG